VLPSFLGPFVSISPTGHAADDVPLTIGTQLRSKRLRLAIAATRPSEWCWAATAAAIASFYAQRSGAGEQPTACQVATQCLFTQCCPEPVDRADPRNRKYALDGALRAVHHLANEPIPGPLDFQRIVREIDAERPVCCHIAWNRHDPDDGHFNAIVGYDIRNQDIDISDCLFQDQTLPYEVFAKAYQGSGVWDITYLTG
jgi:hypothetical protein